MQDCLAVGCNMSATTKLVKTKKSETQINREAKQQKIKHNIISYIGYKHSNKMNRSTKLEIDWGFKEAI